jgi:hypothetical protein
MDKNGIKTCLVIFVFCLLALTSINARAQDINPASQPLFTDQELDDILAPIALYPDPLLAQVLPASTYTEEILDAYDWLNSGGSISEIEWQRWDESVKAIARYPDVLKMMAEYADWTADLGDAFINQPEDVTRSIQRLRWQARDMGNLASNSQQTIVIVGDYIEIIPARPQYIYVPSYDPSIIYYERYYSGSEPFITFGIGLMIGSWLTMDFDWGNHHIIYHGWNRPGWVNQARPHVHVKDLYVNRTRPFINKNWRHDNSHGNPDSFRTAHPVGAPSSGMKSRVSEIRGRSVTAAPPPKGAVGDKRTPGNRGKENRGSNLSWPATSSQDSKKQQPVTVQGDRQRTESKIIDITKRPEPPASDVSQRPASRTIGVTKRPEQPTTSAVGSSTQQTRSAPESVQRSKTPSVTFGGYRGANEAKEQSLRGQASRQSSEKVRTSSAPVKKEEAPERKGASRGDAPRDKQNTGDRPRR